MNKKNTSWLGEITPIHPTTPQEYVTVFVASLKFSLSVLFGNRSTSKAYNEKPVVMCITTADL